MARIDIDQDQFDEQEELEINKSTARKKSRKRVKATRTVSRILVFAISAVCVVGAYPAGKIVFDKLLNSDREISILPDSVLDLIPTYLITKLTNKADEVVNSQEETEEPKSEIAQATISDPNVLAETTPISDAYIEKCMFLGDERVKGFIDDELLTEDVVFAANGATPSNILDSEFTDDRTNLTGSVDTLAAARNPSFIYICMGVNGLSEDDEYISSYISLINKLRESAPNAKIIVCSILPIDEEKASGLDEGINNSTISTVNGKLLSMCREQNIYYLNAYDKLVQDNALNPDYAANGGVLLNSDGYDAWLSYIQKHAVPTS